MYLQDARIKVGYICMYVGHIYMYLHGYGVSILNFIEFIVVHMYWVRVRLCPFSAENLFPRFFLLTFQHPLFHLVSLSSQ
jgi:hypothetical protein